MTESEAIKIFNDLLDVPCEMLIKYDSVINIEKKQALVRIRTAEELAIKALGKQIPKKIEIRKATNDDIESELRDFITVKGRICICPSCRCCIHISELKYCWECGQKLNWESGGE